ncbi:uncharacterized protein LOC110189287 [Drosophila serrata]|uniref:uncharacterized protein LOC110189287 n=1 Tax=Drosophila serrata TaxID=7274 RepID=UPI000A1D0B57|nr:uncharacterized protein LOC110189287 [Drosophila serrata]
MTLDQLPAKLTESKILDIKGIMSVQGSTLESSTSGTQVGKEELKKEITTIKNHINLPIGGFIPTPVEIPSFQMELGLASGNDIPVQELEIFKEPLKQKGFLKKSLLQGILQETSSIEEWKGHFNYSNHVCIEENSPDSWHDYKSAIWSTSNTTAKKLSVNRRPMKHKSLVKKSRLMSLEGKSRAKSQKWIKDILKEDNSNLLQKSKLYGQKKSKDNSSELFKSIFSPQKEYSNWFKNTDINLDFEAMKIDSKKNPDSEHLYDMKALTEECKNIQNVEQITKSPRTLSYDFQDLIHECENLEGDIYEARIPSYGSRYQRSNEVNVDELASYLDNMLQIPREMSAMAKAMYT